MTTRRSEPGLCRGRRQASPAAAPTGTRTVVAGPGAPVSSPAMSGRTALVAHSGPHHPSDPEPGTNPLWPAPPHPHTAGRPRLLCGTTAGARRIGGLTAVGSHFSVCKRMRLTRDPLRPLLPDATSPHEPHVLWVRSLPSLGKLSSVTVHSYETLGNPQTHPHSTTVRLPRWERRSVHGGAGPSGSWGPDLSCTGQMSGGMALGDPEDAGLSPPTVTAGPSRLEGWPL